MATPLLAGSTVGILGGGQLGRMSAMAAQRLGYRVVTFDPSPSACAAAVANTHITATWNDEAALRHFASLCQRATLEFENIPPSALRIVAEKVPVYPSAEVLAICQNRRREKEFLKANGIPCAQFEVVSSAQELKAAVARIGTPCVLKTADFGYDGKGQVKIKDGSVDLDAAWAQLGSPQGVLEGWVPFDLEISVIVARTEDGQVAAFSAAENIHRNHILHLSICPARISEDVARRAEALAISVANKLQVVGLLGVELFVTKGELVVNELAPRPHNSGHHTLDACETSQFEQHIRAVCGLPLGSTKVLSPAAMVNILGDVWHQGRQPDWSHTLADPSAKLHLYDKGTAAPGRKMGHITVTAATAEDAMRRAETLHATL
jgi:5-(carboxyamino)imidazole ribonucleotide synthase